MTLLIVIVNGGPELLEFVLEELYQSRFESVEIDCQCLALNENPYPIIRDLKPDLVLVAMGINETAAYLLQTMLKTDLSTAYIPIWQLVDDPFGKTQLSDATASKMLSLGVANDVLDMN